jgi:hypothetical protein
LTFGVGATLAITQLGAGCVPASSLPQCAEPDAATDPFAGDCVRTPPRDAGNSEGGDAK